MNKVKRVKLRKQIFMYSMAVIVLLLTAFIFNKWIETLMFTISHITIRQQFDLQYHSVRTEICVLITSGVIFFGISFMLPLSYSLFSCIPICYFISWVGYKCAYVNRAEAELDKLKEKVNELLSKESSPLNKVLDICKKNNINERNTKIAVMYYVDRKTPMQIWDWLLETNNNMELDSVYKLLNRLNKKVLPELN